MNTHHPDHPRWQPPHGPNQDCKHRNDLHESWRDKRNGFYPRRFDARRIRRYICHCCGVSFSSQSFKPDGELKRPDILPRLMTFVGAGSKGSRTAPAMQIGLTDWGQVQTPALGVNRRHGLTKAI